MRKLASIQKIESISSIPGADKIEVIQILGWKCVSKKGEFSEGDKCVYFEIDSLLPNKEWSSFLRKKGEESYRLRTVRLRGQISQGLALPVSVFPEIQEAQIGMDVSELLGIEKYEPVIPAQLAGMVKGKFPCFLHKTDEERIQSNPELLEHLKNSGAFYASLKMDGSSMTCYVRDGEFGVCSRNLELKEEGGSSYWRMANELNLKEKMLNPEAQISPVFPKVFTMKNFAIQGELCGPGIQGNPLELKNLGFFVFDVFNIDEDRYLNGIDLISFCSCFSLRGAPLFEAGSDFIMTVEGVLKMAEEAKYPNGAPAEGLVFRPIKTTYIGNSRLSFKAINNNYLLNEK